MEQRICKLEELVKNNLFKNVYQGKKVFITGHCGFKGSWLSFWLKQLGANVTGYSLVNDYEKSPLNELDVDIQEINGDILDLEKLKKSIHEVNPDIIFHLAAQPLVGESYKDPLGTFQTNIMGSLNVYHAARDCKNLKAIVSITTDKVYENKEHIWGYREQDPLGGKDPYSGSKAAMEIVTASYVHSFYHLDHFGKDHNTLIATARAGNVIGGGDWSENRIIPDIMKATGNSKPVIIRKPDAIRPWQHVLEPISGYLLLGQNLLEKKKEMATPFNFGPRYDEQYRVRDILPIIQKNWSQVEYKFEQLENDFSESKNLKLDSMKALDTLGWSPVWEIEDTIKYTVDWYKEQLLSKKNITSEQLDDYIKCAQAKNIVWTK